MANEQNLTRKGLEIDSREKAQRLGRLGGLSKSPKKKLAHQLRALKQKGTDEQYIKTIAFLEESECSTLEIYQYLQMMKEHCKNVHQMGIVVEAMIKLHKIHHGEKLKTENFHHIIDWNGILDKCKINNDRRVRSQELSE